ncbi:LamG-like jellyroll fold domain-containing protein [Streptomyces sp. ISL-36]|uniref:LamG domain-containing protein n=1 Tax=Streptomyces sp. ISL-36 TaxID=2819182 RepID=UPI0027E4CE07|nr:LamG-like jellyroll fold domain-containing protein [Streptomyces sp. ISL-36]
MTPTAAAAPVPSYRSTPVMERRPRTGPPAPPRGGRAPQPRRWSVLPLAKYPAVMSPGDLNSAAGGPDRHPELYAVDNSGQLLEYPGAAPQGPVAAFTAPASLGAVGNTATHGWRLNEGTGTLTADDPGSLSATLSGAYTWTTDATRGKVLQLSGTTGYAATTGPAVNTAGSFTVSAWVKLGSLTSNSTFVSQSGSVGNVSGFQLYYSSGAKAWAFGRHTDGTATSSFTAAYGFGSQVATGRWTHLVGVYDAAANQLLIYVNGRLAGAHAYTGIPWNADSGVQIGRKVYNGVYGEYANGAVSDVRIYPTALPAANAAATGELPGITQLD